jgi:hypothetical protein
MCRAVTPFLRCALCTAPWRRPHRPCVTAARVLAFSAEHERKTWGLAVQLAGLTSRVTSTTAELDYTTVLAACFEESDALRAALIEPGAGGQSGPPPAASHDGEAEARGEAAPHRAAAAPVGADTLPLAERLCALVRRVGPLQVR